MTIHAHSEPGLPRAIALFGYQRHRQVDDLLIVTAWSLVGIALAALTIWSGFGGQIEPVIGLG
ncbi:MAG: hypothetical protein JO289_00725 [Xanthobacteraceae bacterium]|nr:hypothetical protein [Xanthobacteraceae bacterium]MBV9632967.1 hypothetical protein [Xanthobacteraceae bacterium]